MSTKFIKKTIPSIENPDSKFERDARLAFDRISQIPLLDGKLVTHTFTSGDTAMVPHGLSRAYRGFLVVDAPLVVNVFRDGDILSRPTEFIPLQADADVTLTLWVF